ncbi:MAG: hypothetical protein AAF357_07055 [Verrucomicrobiota bacterium]
MKLFRPTSISLRVFAFLLSTGTLHAELATIYYKDGKTVTVELVDVRQAQLFWKRSASAAEVQTAMRSEVDNVIFPTTATWRNAENALESGQLEEAIKLYREVVADPAANYFPFPGNFTSLSKERILRCYRLQMDATKIASQAKIVREEFFNLPPEKKRVEPETAAWSAIANENWEGALNALEETNMPTAETFFLKGRALEALGRKEEAVSEYAGAYVLNFGGSIKLTREALRRSSKLIFEMSDPQKQAELQAQVRIFRDLYGKGSLWEGAPEQLATLADAEIKTMGEADNEMEEPVKAGEEMTGPVVGESASVATLPAQEDRDFLLVEELSDRVFLIGAKGEKETVTMSGGVKKEGESFSFDGTGGQVSIEPADLNKLFIQIRMQFETEQGTSHLIHCRYGNLGGFSVYLKEGELLMDWAPRKKAAMTSVIGKVEPGELTNLMIIFRTNGSRETTVGRTRVDDEVPAGGLQIVQGAPVRFGNAEKTMANQELPPFKGLVHHFSFAAADNGLNALEETTNRFGKNVYLLPPLPAEETGEDSMPEPEAN